MSSNKDGADRPLAIGWVQESPNWEPTPEQIASALQADADQYSAPQVPRPAMMETPRERAHRVAATIRVLPSDPWGWTKLVR